MKKIYVTKMNQNGRECYVCALDARNAVKICDFKGYNAAQETQRPLDPKRVKEIANHVNAGNILPSSVTIGTNRLFEVYHDSDFHGGELDYILFPETEEEFDRYAGTFTILDGQHRLFAFRIPDEADTKTKNGRTSLNHVKPDVNFDISCTIYINPNEELRKMIFLACNEKQKPVPKSLLEFYKYDINQLKPEYIDSHQIVRKLSEEYPFAPSVDNPNGFINTNGIKSGTGAAANEIAKEIRKFNIDSLRWGNSELNYEQIAIILKNYFIAWSNVCNFKYDKPDSKKNGAAVKMAGIRFMLGCFGIIFEKVSKVPQTNIRSESEMISEFEKQIKILINAMDCMHPEKFFTDNSQKFSERSTTYNFIKDCINEYMDRLASMEEATIPSWM